MPEIVIRATARREIKGYGIYLEHSGGPDVADRFLAAVRRTFEELSQTPLAGVSCGFQSTRTARMLRRWHVRGFEDWLIFYLPKRRGIEIVHVIHGARDIESLLDG